VTPYDWFGSFAFYPLGLAAWGPSAAAIGVSLALWLASALLIVAIIALLAIPDARRAPAYPTLGPTRPNDTRSPGPIAPAQPHQRTR
jgi:hypothetical protein